MIPFPNGTWGSWSYTGGTDYDDIEDVIYYEQERFSSPCNRRETRWVYARDLPF